MEERELRGVGRRTPELICVRSNFAVTAPREKMEDWLSYHNEERPHGVIGHKPPISLQTPGGATSQLP